MATPALRTFELPGTARAAAVRGEIRAAGGVRPAVVLCGGDVALADQLARAGFMAVSLAEATGLDPVLAALAAGALGPAPPTVGLYGSGAAAAAVGARAAGSGAVVIRGTATEPHAEPPVPWLRLEETMKEDEARRRTVAWFARYLT